MPDFYWRKFLKRWSEELLTSERGVRAKVPEEAREAQWMGFDPASEAQISSAEARIGAPLPSSYRAFLRTSNGWRNLDHFIYDLLPVDEVLPLAVKTPSWVDIWAGSKSHPDTTPDEIYFDYEHQVSHVLRPEHIRGGLQISGEGDAAICFLNPQVVWPDGEWEVWFLASWLAGATRYRSFVEFMEQRYLGFCQMDEESAPQAPPRVAKILPKLFRDPPWAGPSREEIKPTVPTFDKVVEVAKDPNWRRRMMALELLSRRGDPRAFPIILSALSDPNDRVQGRAPHLLGALGDPRAVDVLLSIVHRREGDVIGAVLGLAYYREPRVIDAMLDVLEGGGMAGVAGAGKILARWKEPRALPLLRQYLFAADADATLRKLAAAAIVEFGEAAEEILREALASDNTDSVLTVLYAIRRVTNPMMHRAIEALLQSPEQTVRERAEALHQRALAITGDAILRAAER